MCHITRSCYMILFIKLIIVIYDYVLYFVRIVRALVLAGKKPEGDAAGAAVINVGLNNVPVTAKTDCANK